MIKKNALCSVGALVILVFTQIVVTSSDVSSYDIMVDANRDIMVDIKDLARVGKAYGSNLVLPREPNKTVVAVLSFDKEPPEVFGDAVTVHYTNSSGMATFELSPNKNYTAIAWSKTTYNYANFTTNESGEASVAIQLGYPRLPNNWAAITFVNKTSDELVSWSLPVKIIVYEIAFNSTSKVWEIISNIDGHTFHSFFNEMFTSGSWSPSYPPELGKNCGVKVINVQGDLLADAVFTPDEKCNANLIAYV